MKNSHSSAARRPGQRSPRWADWDDEALLDLRLCDLGLRVRGSTVEADVERLYGELARRGIAFRPHVWLSDSWFSPDGVPGIAVPFFAAQPRLCRLERRLIGEAEGGSGRWRMQLLRHEAGHALDTAYRLRRRADFRRVFGRVSQPYPRVYVARPASRDYVLHLPSWYAQSHPTEDFAETFAVWLGPKRRWRREYAGWPALEKLELVDRLMSEIAGTPPRNRDRTTIAPLHTNRRTLRAHYRHKQRRYADVESRWDAALRALLRPRAGARGERTLAGHAPALRRQLRQAGFHPYVVEHVLRVVAQRADELGLAPPTGRSAERRLAALHADLIRDLLRRNREHFVR